MNLNGMQRLYGLMGRKCLDNKFQVLTNIRYILISHEMCLFGKCGLSDNFFVIQANLYYRHLLVLALLVNFAFYQQ